MQELRPSRTALRVAARRAAHQILEHPLIFEDPIAGAILPVHERDNLLRDPARLQTPFSRALRAFMVARSRYAEDQLTTAISRGVRQYVILGAGLDTFAYRNPFTSVGLRVFEVDHPTTQSWKVECLKQACISIPTNLNFIAVDFERQDLNEELAKNGWRANLPAFFTWLGVTPYLTRQAFLQTARFIASNQLGSGVSFDFALLPSLLSETEQAAVRVLAQRVADAGEPFRLFFDPLLLKQELFGLGFHEVEDCSGAEINKRYFQGRSDGLCIAGEAAHLLTAWV